MNAAFALRRDAPAWAAAAVAIAALCAIFRREIAAAVSVWNSSTAYGHCWLVLPIAAWLLWERRDVLAARPARPSPWLWLLGAPLALAWVASDLLGIMEGRQLAAVGFVLLALLAALGPRLWWALSPGFLYLVFLVPFGAFLTPALQGFTARFIVGGLHALDIPVQADAFQIAIPEGVFYVAEACAGLRFLIASVAFGVLYAVTMFASPWRRAAFIAVSCVVPVVANGVRGLGIVLLGHALGSAEAGAADHLIYGWVFFSAVIVLLALAGLPFREPMAPPQTAPLATGRLARPGRLLLACAPVVALALAAPSLAAGPTLAAVAARPGWAAAAPAGCAGGPVRASGPRTDADFVCDGQHLHLATIWLPVGANPATILDAARLPALDGLGGDIDTKLWAPPGQAPWMLVRARDTQRASAYAIVVDGVQGVGGLHDRLRMLRGMLGHGDGTLPHALSVTLPASDDAETVLKAFLSALGGAPNQQGTRL